MNELLSAVVSAYTILEKAMPSVFIGMFLANLSSSGNFTTKAKGFLPYIERVAGLPPAIALVLMLSVADRTAGMAALEAGRKRSNLSDKQVIAINLAAKAPSVVQFFVFSFIPLLAALFPHIEATRFLLAYFLAFLTISTLGWVLFKLSPGHSLVNCEVVPATSKHRALPAVVREAFNQTIRPFIRIAVWMFSMSAVVMLAVNSGVLTALSRMLSLGGGLLDANTIGLMAAGLISMIGGVAAVGAAWQEGIIAQDKIVPLLFLTSIVHNVYDLISSSLPRTIAIYGRELGIKVSLAGFIVTQVVMVGFFFLISCGVL